MANPPNPNPAAPNPEPNLEGLIPPSASVDEMDAGLITLAKQLLTNPKTRKQTLKLTKELYPNEPLPEVDLENAIDARLAEGKKEITELKESLQKERQLSEISAKRGKLKQEHGFSDEDITKVEKFMVDNKIGDYDSAARFYKQSQEVAPPTPSTFGPIELPIKQDDMKDGLKSWGQREAHKAIDELKVLRQQGSR